MDKRGISSIVSVVLLIGFVVVIAGLIILFGSRFVEDLTETTEEEGKIAIAVLSDLKINAEFVELLGNTLRIRIENLAGEDIEVEGFKFRIIGSGGTATVDIINSIGFFEKKIYSIYLNASIRNVLGDEIELIEVIPFAKVTAYSIDTEPRYFYEARDIIDFLKGIVGATSGGSG